MNFKLKGGLKLLTHVRMQIFLSFEPRNEYICAAEQITEVNFLANNN
jgi:hypothetical protein